MKKIGRTRKVLLWSVVGGAAVTLTCSLGLIAYAQTVRTRIDTRMEQLKQSRSSSFYAVNPPLRIGQVFLRSELRAFLEDQGYKEKYDPSDLLAGEFAWEKTRPPVLVLFRPAFAGAGHAFDPKLARIEFEEKEGALLIEQIRSGEGEEKVDYFESLPKQIGTFLAGRLRTQAVVGLSDIPVSMRHAVMAIEDAHFLEHHGVSLRGTLRAFFKNIQAGKASQGGSTITQQLMKNLFFSQKKQYTRKFKEALYAFLTEANYSKELILEAYLNEVYFGQWSTHEIHGVAEAARYYFNSSVGDITLSQSALLAAIVQAPNAHDPRRYPDRALKRRNLVLKKMEEANFILPEEYEMASVEPLGVVPAERSLDDVEYFLDLVVQQLPSSIASKLDSDVITLYVTLNPYLQGLASRSLNQQIDNLVKNHPKLAAKIKKGFHLQGSLIAINPQDCSVLAVQGGKNYRQTQFNRVLQGKRQPGSLFKPFVVLAAMREDTTEGPITPTTEFEDAPFEWKFDKQLWKPRNYDNKYRGPVTVRRALEESINVPTAKIAQRVGVPAMVTTIRDLGITSPFMEVPSIALGSAEVSPYEIAEAYTTLARLGQSCQIRPFFEVYDESRNLILQNTLVSSEKIPAAPAYQTVHMMKGTFTHGTARSASWSGLNFQNFAGKTGTTNDAKDAWFVGFSPELLVVVWIGFDEEEKVGLTGASAALPVWLDFVKNAGPFRSAGDFPVPEGLVVCEAERPKTEANAANPTGEKYFEYYREGTEPRNIPCAKAEPTPRS